LEKEYKIAIIGLGYVGLPLALAFAKHYKVVGYDVNAERVGQLNKGVDANLDVEVEVNSNLIFSNNENDLKKSNIYIITVPTPVDKDNVPDLTSLKSASELVANSLQKGDIVIYESTVYPGVTEDICVPILAKISGLSYNHEFYCGYSPERISPGAEKYTLENVVKVTSGSTSKVADLVDDLYKKIIKVGTYKALSIKVAEAAKVIENTQRDVNIALMNELAMMFDKMDINTSEVLSAAKSKWNFLDFKPGLVGGHCIGVDPYYLLHKSEEMGYKPTLLHSSRTINNNVASFIVDKTIKLMIDADKEIKGASVLIMGYTFKENCADTRNTKVKDIMDGLESYSCRVSVFDPYLSVDFGGNFIGSPFLGEKRYDAIIVAVSHNKFIEYTTNDFKQLSNGKLVLLDIKGIYKESSWKF
jgi:UDP-N-acetyl-D-galactosamine dehydrogenase|tara:strand:+ start:398 stop:1645 length:1248 start_codon:yes stop_codon:yes gene_type:complete